MIMHGERINCMLVGRTGDGKSASGNKIGSRKSNTDQAPFGESSGSASHTGEPKGWLIGNFHIIDTPGLMDTKGTETDEDNIKKIVIYGRAQGYLNAIVLVFNEQTVRFDSGMQSAVKLLVDSFGPKILGCICILFTRAYGHKTLQESKDMAAEITKIISECTGINVPHIPSFQVDCHPEELARLGVPPELVAARIQTVNATIDQLIMWAETKPPVNTTDAIFGEYEFNRKKREAEEEAERQRQAAAVAEEGRQAAAKAEALARREAEYRKEHAASHGIVDHGPHNWGYHSGKHKLGIKVKNHSWSCGCGGHQSRGERPAAGKCNNNPIYGYKMKSWEEHVAAGGN